MGLSCIDKNLTDNRLKSWKERRSYTKVWSSEMEDSTVKASSVNNSCQLLIPSDLGVAEARLK